MRYQHKYGVEVFLSAILFIKKFIEKGYPHKPMIYLMLRSQQNISCIYA